jgi:hypothetical protein
MKFTVLLVVILLSGVSMVFCQSQPAKKRDTVKVSTIPVNSPLYIVKIRELAFELMPPEDGSDYLKFLDTAIVEEVDVYKGEDALKRYGDKAREGVIVIHLKVRDKTELPLAFREQLKELEN